MRTAKLLVVIGCVVAVGAAWCAVSWLRVSDDLALRQAAIVSELRARVDGALPDVVPGEIATTGGDLAITARSGTLRFPDGTWLRYAIHTMHETERLSAFFGCVGLTYGDFDLITLVDERGRRYESTVHACDGLYLPGCADTKPAILAALAARPAAWSPVAR